MARFFCSIYTWLTLFLLGICLLNGIAWKRYSDQKHIFSKLQKASSPLLLLNSQLEKHPTTPLGIKKSPQAFLSSMEKSALFKSSSHLLEIEKTSPSTQILKLSKPIPFSSCEIGDLLMILEGNLLKEPSETKPHLSNFKMISQSQNDYLLDFQLTFTP